MSIEEIVIAVIMFGTFGTLGIMALIQIIIAIPRIIELFGFEIKRKDD